MLLFSLINAHGMKKGQIHTSNGFASIVHLFVNVFTACKLFNCL